MAPVLSKTPETLVTSGWSDYALLDSGDGKKLERYGRYTVVRPEPQCFWSPRDPKAFENATATFCLLYTSPSPRDRTRSRMPSSA